MADDRIYLNVPFDEKDAVKEHGARWDAHAKLWYMMAPAGADYKRLHRESPLRHWMWRDPMDVYWRGALPLPTDATRRANVATAFMAHAQRAMDTMINRTYPGVEITVSMPGVDLTDPMNWMIHVGNESSLALCMTCQRMTRANRQPADTACISCARATAKREKTAITFGADTTPETARQILLRHTRGELADICETLALNAAKNATKAAMADAIIGALGPAEAARSYAFEG